MESFFDEEALHNAAFGTGLVSDERHAQDSAGEDRGFGEILGDLDASAFPRPPA